MLKKFIVAVIIISIFVGLYIAQVSQIDRNISEYQPGTIDDLTIDEAARAWEPFYKVRAKILDGQTADFRIPKELQKMEGEEIEMTGAGVFYGSGCTRNGDLISITDFYLIPSTGLAEACEIQPDIEMRWKILVTLQDSWTINYNDMIGIMVKVRGQFRIDTSKPFIAAFYIDNAIPEIQSR